MKADISVITPVFNEAENVEDLCLALDEYAKDKPYKLELIFVDDGSSDNSFKKVSTYPFKNAVAKAVALSKNYGSHAAIRAGLTQATGKYSMFFSADLQEPVELIGMLYDKMQEGYDIVYVQKRKTETSKSEGILSKLFARLTRKYAVQNFPPGGVNNLMCTEKIRNLVNERIEPNSSIFLQIMDMGFHHTIIDCDYVARQKGKSKWTFGRKIKMFIDSFVSFSFAPIRAVTIIGLIFSFIGIVYAIYIVVMKLFNFHTFAAGFPTLIAVVLVGFGLTNIAIGVIAEYLWRTFDAARNKQVFIIDKTVDIHQLDCQEECKDD